MGSSEYIIVQIGAKIRQIRKEQGFKLGELADKSGISIAMLSKIENGRVFPTLSSLIDILKTLQIDLSHFFSDFTTDESFPGFIFLKRLDYQPIKKEEEAVGFHYELVLNHFIEASSVEISLLTLNSGAKRNRVSTSGLEYIYMIKGRVQFHLGDEIFDMEEGDSLFFDGNIPHVPFNEYETDAVFLVIYFIDIE